MHVSEGTQLTTCFIPSTPNFTSSQFYQFPNEKERKFARKRGGGEKEMGVGAGGRWCLTFFSKVL